MDLVRAFKPVKVLSHDPVAHSIVLLGTTSHAHGDQAILILKKTSFSLDSIEQIAWEKLESLESNDIYTQQRLKLVRETPELYESIVRPYIDSFPSERTNWVRNILTYKTESEKLLYDCPDFVILPDFKWDIKDVNTLYLQAIVRDGTIKSLRDIRYSHLAMLRQIRSQATKVAAKWGIESGGLRLYVHYQPSYYHFHVHIVQVNYTGFPGTSIGQAHLLDDIISLLEVHGNLQPPIFQKLALSYTLGEFHALYEPMTNALAQLEMVDQE
ncbi:hypothetical protein PIIN_03473 [Serendipita indica DSM 11827]|uniref:Uncharacterized protein n=1 Tax=Serendipita indica (strain DSM 11827) TaxID=1109443 RepID=G4TDX4_SERID|nr:hypothetical protein PIIN_03473 [Serendipita indica DSM 11827]